MADTRRAEVKARLKKYRLLGAKRKNLELEKAHLEKELALCYAPIAHYDYAGGRGNVRTSPVEKTAARHDRITSRLAQLAIDIEAVELERQQIDNALEVLPEEEQEIIRALFFKGMTITSASIALAYSERTLRRRAAEALEDMAIAL
jgi:DNA-directed RNA polymerase specialized sigma subunit